jgi:hypothetical protein
MLVYGDQERVEDAAALAREVEERLGFCEAMPFGMSRYQALVAAFIRAAELVQGIADSEYHQIGADEISERQDTGNAVLLNLAQAIAASWKSSFTDPLELDCQAQLATLSTAGVLKTRQAEGYAFYALYPESYIAAAQRSGLGPDTTVIGIRSIGTGLAALVAAALGAAPATTVRPHGHPFDRQITLSDHLARRLLESKGSFAIVDEGPGISGSSFNCVADWLVGQGIAETRIHFFPSHGGNLGHAAKPDHRARWSRAQKHWLSFEQIILKPALPAQRLERWVADAIGPLDKPLRDISGGGWRSLSSNADTVPADSAMERLKFLATSNGENWLVKFAGLGSLGEAKLDLACKLSVAGFTLPPKALCHGFLVTPWIEGTATPGAKPPHDRLRDYLALRAGVPATSGGASLAELFAMAIYNIEQRCGKDLAEAAGRTLGDPARFDPVPCCTDNRLHAWEWLETPKGWLKLDGLDHHAAHDLLGCQDITWDLAGAVIELDLSKQEREHLRAELSTGLNRGITPDFLRVNQICYLAFQIGLWTMAKDRNGTHEHPKIEKNLARYEQHLRAINCVNS